MVNRGLAEAIVGFLRLSGEPYDFGRMTRFSPRDWEKTAGWLDHAGLTLYLLERLRACGATEVLPHRMLARFEQNLADNKCRVDAFVSETGRINEKLNQAGIQYVIIKGLSQWPEFCSNPYWRGQCDLDYLVARQSFRSARCVLEECDYEARSYSPVQVQFEQLRQRFPSRFDNQYQVQTTPAVELHLGIWDESSHRVSLEEPEFILDRSRMQEWGGLRFPVLSDQDAFLLQVLHLFQHMLSYWVKLSWLLEIGHFMEKRWRDTLFWEEFDKRLEGSPRLAEFSTIALELVAKMFSAPVPEVAQHWKRFLRPAARLWLDHYAWNWAFGDSPLHESRIFPGSKLSLFLHREYIPDSRARRDVVQRQLIPWRKPSVIVAPGKHRPWFQVQVFWLQSAHVLRQASFHAGAGLRYIWELPHWHELKRSYPGLPQDTI